LNSEKNNYLSFSEIKIVIILRP